VYHADNLDILAEALRDLVGMLNSPRQDDILLKEAGVALDRALFPLLVRIGASGSLSVIDLAERVGRDHSTVSRQISKLAALNYVTRQHAPHDQRVREAVITASGRRVVKRISEARRKLLGQLLADWSLNDRDVLASLNRRLADAMAIARAKLDPSKT
jgi:DNA-binding MarR family transcriptional regulator